MNAAEVLHDFVLARLDAEPLKKRAELYRALAELAATPAERKTLRTLAAECELIEKQHEQLLLDFRRRADGGTKEGRQ